MYQKFVILIGISLIVHLRVINIEPVPAAFLGLIKGKVGRVVQLVEGIPVHRRVGDADTAGDAVVIADILEFVGADALMQHLHLRGRVCVGDDVLHQDTEFVAAETPDDVALAEFLPDDVADFLQDLIADRMSVGIVDLLEMVDVNHHEGLEADPLFAVKPLLDHLLRTLLVEHTGQQVALAHFQKLCLRAVRREQDRQQQSGHAQNQSRTQYEAISENKLIRAAGDGSRHHITEHPVFELKRLICHVVLILPIGKLKQVVVLLREILHHLIARFFLRKLDVVQLIEEIRVVGDELGHLLVDVVRDHFSGGVGDQDAAGTGIVVLQKHVPERGEIAGRAEHADDLAIVVDRRGEHHTLFAVYIALERPAERQLTRQRLVEKFVITDILLVAGRIIAGPVRVYDEHTAHTAVFRHGSQKTEVALVGQVVLYPHVLGDRLHILKVLVEDVLEILRLVSNIADDSLLRVLLYVPKHADKENQRDTEDENQKNSHRQKIRFGIGIFV